MIQSVAQGISRAFPEYAYRIGGDEFIALFVNGTKAVSYTHLDVYKRQVPGAQ